MITPTVRANTGASRLELDANRKSGGHRREHCRGVPAAAGEHERDRREQEEHADDVVAGAAGLRGVHHRRGHQQCDAEHGRGAGAAGAADAPRRRQRPAQPQQVERRRQGVVAQQHDPEAVQHLGGRWIERRQVLDVGEPQRGDMAGLRERRGPGKVVPQRVERPHAHVVGLKRGRRPLGQHRDRGDDRDTRAGDLKAAAIRGAAARSGMPGLTFGGEPGGAESDGHARCGDRPEREPADAPEHLEDRDQHGQRGHRLGEAGERPGPIGQPPAADRDRSEQQRGSDQEQRDRAQRVAPGAHRAPGETLPRAGDRLGTLELDPMTGRRLGRPVVAALAALAIAVALAGCGGGGETHQPTATQLPLVDGANVVAQVRQCDKGANAYCAIELVVDRPALQDLDGPGRRGARQAPQPRLDRRHRRHRRTRRPPSRPGHKLRVTYATASGDLRGVDLGSIQRSRRIALALSRALFDHAPAMSRDARGRRFLTPSRRRRRRR